MAVEAEDSSQDCCSATCSAMLRMGDAEAAALAASTPEIPAADSADSAEAIPAAAALLRIGNRFAIPLKIRAQQPFADGRNLSARLSSIKPLFATH